MLMRGSLRVRFDDVGCRGLVMRWQPGGSLRVKGAERPAFGGGRGCDWMFRTCGLRCVDGSKFERACGVGFRRAYLDLVEL